MNVAGAPVITFRRIGTRNSGRGNSPLFSQTLRAYCGEILFFPFYFSLSFFLPRAALEEDSSRGELEQEEGRKGEKMPRDKSFSLRDI